MVFDTGHQAYVHKLLTGRRDFSQLRSKGGLSGYPSRAESEHDVVENSHASTALSWADGIAKANELQGRGDRHVVAVIGDGALTGGMAWEALNNIAAGQDRRLVIVVNDNGRSYAPTIGGLAHHLDTLRTTRGYENVLSWGKRTLRRSGAPGRATYDALHGMKKGIKDVLAPQGMFEDLGIKYVGPVDGHDVRGGRAGAAQREGVRRAGHRARHHREGPRLRSRPSRTSRTGSTRSARSTPRPACPSRRRGSTGPACSPTRSCASAVGARTSSRSPRRCSSRSGLAPFAAEFPTRVFDVGIAEQHAATSAAGMAFGGLHPVVAVYATFLNRAFDQVLMDVALHKAGVTFVLDRAGLTGDDGASHNGMWDMAMLGVVPGLRLAAPRDEETLRDALRAAVDVDDAPTVVRYPKGALVDPSPRSTTSTASTSSPGTTARPTRSTCSSSASARWRRPRSRPPSCSPRTACASTVVDPRWVLPVPAALTKLVGEHDHVVTIEDGVVDGGLGSLVAQRAREAGIATPVQAVGIPRAFLDHATREQLVTELRLRPADIARGTLAALAACVGRGAVTSAVLPDLGPFVPRHGINSSVASSTSTTVGGAPDVHQHPVRERPTEPAPQPAWRGFADGPWTDEIDVRDFIQRNYTPYTGDASFLAGPTAAHDRDVGAADRDVPGRARARRLRRRPAHAVDDHVARARLHRPATTS